MGRDIEDMEMALNKIKELGFLESKRKSDIEKTALKKLYKEREK